MSEDVRKRIEISEAYYKAMSRQDYEEMASYLHPNVELLGPISKLRGR